MGSGDYYKGALRDYHRDPFLKTMLRPGEPRRAGTRSAEAIQQPAEDEFRV